MWRARTFYTVLWAGEEKSGRVFQDAQSFESEAEALNFIFELQSQDNIDGVDFMKRVIWDRNRRLD